MRVDGGWFSFDTIGEAIKFLNAKRLNGDVKACLLLRPLDDLGEVSMAKLDVRTPRTGCEACATEVEVLDSKSIFRRLLSHLFDNR